ncbi:unnamed protein product (macronuclear) [Paramecium tetraurelia]|uniref:Uncharacterized protein n=1 Tax=Paramecium tetraurelia TaxID=5888 RepID=A0BYL2_PARTE|nr:uncharacterized protein GSPATT00033482001 [Paramecium tetraurelia]CAK63629.1 unnamed protein product [Paramecium tetraurelia]|eukprot:XP_001431027.1 hypothetical protein (macronuclear) [Paramecium tetraurelia strain d4-2]
MRSLSQACITENSENIEKFIFKQKKLVTLRSDSPTLSKRLSQQPILVQSDSPLKKHKTCSSEIPLSNGKMFLKDGKILFLKQKLPKLELPQTKCKFDPKVEILKWIQTNKSISPLKKRVAFRAIKESNGQNRKSLIF